MRATLDNFLSKYNNDDVYLLHADMWRHKRFSNRFPNRCINVGVQEPNLINIGLGLSSQGKQPIIYGVAGFVIYKAYEQMKLYRNTLGDNLIFVNAGANGCYSHLGVGHQLDDDFAIMDLLRIKTYEPLTQLEFIQNLKHAIRSTGTHYIRLGWDTAQWK